jgi:hypothetical protein
MEQADGFDAGASKIVICISLLIHTHCNLMWCTYPLANGPAVYTYAFLPGAFALQHQASAHI